MKATLSLIITLFTLTSLHSQQPFQRTYGGNGSEYAFALKKTADKGYLCGGYTNGFSAQQYDFYIVKTDSAGTALWAKSYGSNKRDELFALTEVSGGYLLAGYSNSPSTAGGYDGTLLRTNTVGDTLWAWMYGGSQDDYLNTVCATADGGFAAAGYTTQHAFAADSGNILLLKINSAGLPQWSKILGAPAQYTDAYSIIQTADKGFAISGYTNGFGELSGDVFLMKTDSSGNIQWTKTYGGKGADWTYTAWQTADKGFILGGSVSTDSTSLDLDLLIIKTDSMGDTLWTRSFGTPNGSEYGQRLVISKSGYAIAGYSNGFSSGFDGFMVKVDQNGDTLANVVYGNTGDDEWNDITLSGDGGFVLAGQENSFGLGGYDLYMVKTDSMGNTPCYSASVHPAKKQNKIYVNTVTGLQTVTSIQNRYTGFVISSSFQDYDPCNPNSVTQIPSTENIKVSPNPATEVLMVENLPGEGVLVLTDLLGKILLQKKVSLTTTLDLNGIVPGSYFLHFSNEKTIHSCKILVNK